MNYQRGKVIEVTREEHIPVEGQADHYIQELRVQPSSKGESVGIMYGSEFQPLAASQRLQAGTNVILISNTENDQTNYAISDVYRLPSLLWLLIGFGFLVTVVAGKKGLSSIAGMLLSVGVLFGFILPQIIAGHDPLLISFVGAGAIAVLSLYLSHGLNIKSHLSLAALLATLLASALLAAFSIQVTQLFGFGSEEAAFLQFGPTQTINLQGLLLGGIILGALGVLDDSIVAQVSVVMQLKSTNHRLGFSELYHHGLEVGKDHVASLVNTLVLAYTGANLPLFLLFYLGNGVPAWVSLNSEVIAEEVVRTLVGSIGLVLAVPLATMLAAAALSKYPQAKLKTLTSGNHTHSH